MKKQSRRLVLKAMGLQFVLPLLNGFAPLSALAQSASRKKKFIGVFFPNGTFIPDGDPNGAWHWNNDNGVLNVLKQGANPVNQNVMILRGLRNGHPGRDPHWQNCTGFLSGNRIRLERENPRCGKTIDQYIADSKTAYYRSIEVGGPYFHIHTLGDHPNYPDLYMNRISWLTDTQALTPNTDPYALFNRIFGSGASNQQVAYLSNRKLSVLDGVINDLNVIRSKTDAEGKLALDVYTDGLRDIETSLQQSIPTCDSPGSPTLDYSDKNQNYVDRVVQFQRMIVFAMKCDLTNVATLMYSPSVSGEMTYTGDIGGNLDHHACAHHGGAAARQDRLKSMNRMHLGLLKNLINLLKSNGLIDDTQLFSEGFATTNGEIVRNENNTPLFEYFALHLKGQVSLLPENPTGLYQFALLSDDGSELKVTDPVKRTIISSDRVQMSTFTVAESPVRFRRGERIPIEVNYFQGPRFHTALILMWRPWNGSSEDPANGITGNEKFFDYNFVPSVPTDIYKGILSRGWRPLKSGNFVLPDGVSNPCY